MIYEVFSGVDKRMNRSIGIDAFGHRATEPNHGFVLVRLNSGDGSFEWPNKVLVLRSGSAFVSID